MNVALVIQSDKGRMPDQNVTLGAFDEGFRSENSYIEYYFVILAVLGVTALQ